MLCVQMASPMAGSFYRSPAPGEPSFCKEGDKVTKGQTVCIIEAMKLMNEIEVGLQKVKSMLNARSMLRSLILTRSAYRRLQPDLDTYFRSPLTAKSLFAFKIM